MAKSNRSKWVIGLTGTALSAFVISQVGANQANQGNTTMGTVVTKSMSKQEKEFVQLDWTNYSINGVSVSEGVVQSDRQSRRS